MRTPRTPGRTGFFVLALVMALSLAGLGANAFERRVAAFQPLGFDAKRDQGMWRVTAVDHPQTGLKPGDGILLVAGQQPPEVRELRHLLRAAPTTELLVRRGGEISTVSYRRPPLDVDTAYLVMTAIGAVYLLIGLYTALKVAGRRAHLFFLWSFTAATLYIVSPVNPVQDGMDKTIHLVDLLSRTLLPSLTLHLFLVVPTPLFRRPGARRAVAFLYLPTAFLLALHADQIYFGGRFVFGPVTAAKVQLLDRLELCFIALASLLAVFTLLVRLSRTSSWEPRRQLQWLVFGMLGGYGPFLVLYVLPTNLGVHTAQWWNALSVLPLALVPLSFAYAILKYKLWDIGVILRDTVSYTLTVLLGLFGFSLINLAVQRGISEELALLRNLLSFAAGLAIAGVLVPTKNVISAGLERLHYRGRLVHRHSLAALGQELLYERDLERLCTTLLERLAQGLEVPRTALYLAQGGALIAVRPEERLPPTLGFDAFGPGCWGREVVSISPLALPAEEATAMQRLFAAGYRYAFPLAVRQVRVGVALVSYKGGDAPLNSEDLELARGLLNQAALAIENARLLEEVHHQLAEVVKLKEHNRGIIESSPAGIAVLDDEGRVVSANHAFATITGVDPRRAVGTEIATLLPIRPLPPPGEGPVEVSYCTMAGEEHHLQLSLAPHRQGTDRPLQVLIIQDVSERVAIETALKEKERLASLGMLAAGVAHEVNTPLTGISSYAQLLLAETDKNSPHYTILQKMERQTFRAAQIVNNLLEFARHRHDTLSSVHLESVVEESLQMLRERARDAAIEVVFERPREPLAVAGHEGELHQVVTNLLVNAIEAMTGRGGTLTIALQGDEQRVVLRVSDTGPGIPADRLQRIFEPFFSSKLAQGGSGLGLSITYNIVSRHGGEIRVQNHPDGPGCTFTVELPRHRP